MNPYMNGAPLAAKLIDGEDEVVYPTTAGAGAAPGLYNFDPSRPKTDTRCGTVFIGLIGGFFLWGIIGAATSGGEMMAWEFDGARWNVSEDGGSCYQIPAQPSTTPLLGPTDPAFDPVCTEVTVPEITEYVAAPVVAAIFGSFVCGLGLLSGFNRMPFFMVYFIIGLKIALPSVAAVVLMSYTDDMMYTVLVLFLLSVVMAASFFFWWSTVKLVARLFKEASVGLRQNMSLLSVNVLFAVSAVMIKLAMIAVSIWYIANMNVVPSGGGNDDDDVGDDSGGDDDSQGRYACELHLTTATTVYWAIAVFVIGWFAFWAIETRNYIVADTIGCWYWHGKSDGQGIKRAVNNAFHAHFGSLAYAALVIWFVEQLKNKARKRSKSTNPITCCIGMIAECLLSYIEYLCKMSVIVVAITGQPFFASGKEVVRLFTESFGNMVASTGVWWLPNAIIGGFNFLVAAIWAGLTGVIVYYWVHADCSTTGKLCIEADVQSCNSTALTFAISMGVICYVLMHFLLHFFTAILLTVVDTVYLCYIMDKSRGVVSKPELHQTLDLILAQRTDLKKAREEQLQNGPPTGQRQAPPRYVSAATTDSYAVHA